MPELMADTWQLHIHHKVTLCLLAPFKAEAVPKS